MNRRAMLRVRILAALAVSLALAGCSKGTSDDTLAPLAGAKIGGDFALVDKAGKPVRFHDFNGKYRIVYFGYTYCPDACPNDLAVLMNAFNQFAKDKPQSAAKVQSLFVSIDPARDTPQVVGEFAAAFSPRLIGLTGSESQVAEAVKMFAAYRNKGTQTAEGGYLMDHSRIAYLMDQQGKPLAILPVDQGAGAVAADLAKWTS